MIRWSIRVFWVKLKIKYEMILYLGTYLLLLFFFKKIFFKKKIISFLSYPSDPEGLHLINRDVRGPATAWQD